jgi:NADH-quinone oxidoreductase subunit A
MRGHAGATGPCAPSPARTTGNIEVIVHFEYSVVLIYLTVSAVIVGLALWLGRFLRPNLPDPQKAQIYECGERPIGSAWFNFNPRFYLIALVFIVFDAEIALTFPVATVAREWIARQDGSGWVAVVEILLFFAVLLAALAYVWGKGELDWSRELTSPEEMP